MPFQINIFNVKTNSLNNNANMSLGPTLHNSHTANTKWIGTNMALGDFSPTGQISTNGYTDVDISDQDQIANPSAPIANQF
ncbi:MAG: spore germination protein [Bacillota bacterium]|nr:spore germination protein [Bacillota bacterium]